MQIETFQSWNVRRRTNRLCVNTFLNVCAGWLHLCFCGEQYINGWPEVTRCGRSLFIPERPVLVQQHAGIKLPSSTISKEEIWLMWGWIVEESERYKALFTHERILWLNTEEPGQETASQAVCTVILVTPPAPTRLIFLIYTVFLYMNSWTHACLGYFLWQMTPEIQQWRRSIML